MSDSNRTIVVKEDTVPPVGMLPESERKVAVLVIDDDLGFLDAMSAILTEHGYEAVISASATKGLTVLQYSPNPIRVVLLDYTMPGLNGAAALKHIRELHPTVKIVGVTGLEASQLPEDFRTGADRVMQKPFQTAQLLETLNELLHAPAAPPPPDPKKLSPAELRKKRIVLGGRLAALAAFITFCYVTLVPEHYVIYRAVKTDPQDGLNITQVELRGRIGFRLRPPPEYIYEKDRLFLRVMKIEIAPLFNSIPHKVPEVWDAKRVAAFARQRPGFWICWPNTNTPNFGVEWVPVSGSSSEEMTAP